MLIKQPNASWCSRVCREVHKQFLISERHPLIFDYLRSYLALVEERRRYFLEGRSVIHPLSMFSLFWKSLMIFVNLGHLVASTLRFCIITEPFNMLYIEDCDIILAIIQVICLIDIIICFNIGILKSESALIVLDRRRIARAYLLSYFIPDLISATPVSFILLMIRERSRKDMLIPDLLPFFRGVRIVTILDDLKTLLQYAQSLKYLLETMKLISSTGTGFSMFKTYHGSEIVVNSFIMLLGTMFKMYSVVYWLQTYMTVYNSTLRYQELLDQVEKFMSHHQFPGPLMRRLRDYYEYRFQEHYYKESVALGYLSGASVVTDRTICPFYKRSLTQLRDEIRLNTYQILADKVAVLQNLPPAFLGRVMGYLELDIFLPDDLVFHVGDLCKHVYFVCTGTLALYTVKGVEAMHFEDGDFVGGVSLLTLSARRVTTLVAIEITHTYRLSFDHLRELAKLNPALLDRIKKETFIRFSQITHIDELILIEGSPAEDN
ncbi:potassium voltage-gated channel subfamily H member 2-like [Cydia amplana]|uniref:potassium voltage-gated channel subfamily H member 2-like n=1 Tax=Cydia amplana TaxID=1869771 RepID=UPI002FE57C56